MINDKAYKEKVTLRDYLAVILKRKGIILLSFFAVLVSTIAGSIMMTPIYEATTTIQIEERELGLGKTLLTDVRGFGDWARVSPIDSEIEIIKSRTIAERVVRKLNLDKKVHNLPKDVSLNITPIVADSSVQPGVYKVAFTDSLGHFRVLDEKGKLIGQGEAGSAFKANGLSFTISNVKAREGSNFKFSVHDFHSAVKGLQGDTTVEPVRNTNIIKISVKSDSQEGAARTANAIAEGYIDQNLKHKTQQAFSAREFIEKQLDVVRKELKGAEAALESYKTKKGIVVLTEEAKAAIEKVTRTELDRAKIESQRKEMEALLAVLQEGRPFPKKGLVLSVSGIDNRIIGDLAKKMNDLEIERIGLLESFTEKHPTVVALQNQIDEVKRKLINEVEATVNGLKEREAALSATISRYEADLKRLPEAELNLVSLMRTSKVNEGIYTFLLQKHEEARLAEAAEIGNIRIVDPAIPPKKPIKPRTMLNTILGAIVGLVMGLGMAFFLESQDTSLKTVEEVEEKVALPVFGVIPNMGDRLSRRALRPVGNNKIGESALQADLITHLEPRSLASEAYRSLRTNIQFADPDRKAKAFLVTSPGPGEGKTITIANLAITMAQMGSKTLLVETDFRRPLLHQVFGQDSEPGLTNLLGEEIEWTSVVQETRIQNLHLISCGPIPPNPSELLGSNKMASIIEKFKEHYDIVLFDSPPVIAVTDAAVLGPKLDGIFLVVEAGKSSYHAVQRARRLLESVHARLMGVIFNKIGLEETFGRFGYYYSYHIYYHEEGKKVKGEVGWFSSLKKKLRNE